MGERKKNLMYLEALCVWSESECKWMKFGFCTIPRLPWGSALAQTHFQPIHKQEDEGPRTISPRFFGPERLFDLAPFLSSRLTQNILWLCDLAAQTYSGLGTVWEDFSETKQFELGQKEAVDFITEGRIMRNGTALIGSCYQCLTAIISWPLILCSDYLIQYWRLSRVYKLTSYCYHSRGVICIQLWTRELVNTSSPWKSIVNSNL